ncbi:MAG: leucyl aminopeptidase family protein [Bdellovibrionales bacterium]|nr:leucyl aminopeptidase family protein [Bdellovibrionales bacterium]
MRFQFTSKKPTKKSTGPLSSSNEMIIAPLSAIKKPLSALSSRRSMLPAEVEAQWNKKQKKLAQDLEKKGSRTAEVALADGTSILLIFLGEGLSTYELHTQLRKQFEGCLSSYGKGENEFSVDLTISMLSSKAQGATLKAITALAEISCWEPTKFGKAGEKQQSERKKHQKPYLIEVACSLTPTAFRDAIEQGQALGEANNSVRTLADLPANELNPASYQEHARDFAKSHGLTYEFWNIAELTKRKAGAFLAVNRADPHSKAGIAVLKYRPKKSTKKNPVLALVGKGLCFDTGGYNVKTGNYMLGMHGDMTGSALALSLCGYFAKINAPFEVHAYLALAENLISPTAYKPNEVVIASDGTSIEVVDTDAEGRMVLSDTLAFVRKTKPTLCIDYATLTGAAIRSLDTRRGAVFSNREKLAQLAVQAGDESGERTWNFPIGQDYREMLKSKIADIQQCASVNNADHIYAATFLSHFIGDETPWVHLDLVPADNKGGLGLVSTDTTGFGVFWTAQLVDEALRMAAKEAPKGKRQ